MGRAARIRRGLSNVFLGVAVGLLAYYSLTSFLGWLEQRSLRDAASSISAFSLSDPAEALEAAQPDDPFDFSGWEAEDQAYWTGLADDGAFGRIVIPAIGIDRIVVPDTDTEDLRRGPGWMRWTSLPGASGTCGIAGHRTTYGAPFRRLDELVPGDSIDLYSPYRVYRYEVLRTLVVRPWETGVLHPEEQPSLALSACHPPFSAQYRIVVQAELVGVQRLEATEE